LVSAVDRQLGSEILLTWVAATGGVGGISGYRVYYSATNTSVAILAAGIRSTTASTTKIVKDLTDGVTLYFIVRAYDTGDDEDDNVVIKSAAPSNLAVPGDSLVYDHITDEMVYDHITDSLVFDA
jgi:hypothetical protein